MTQESTQFMFMVTFYHGSNSNENQEESSRVSQLFILKFILLTGHTVISVLSRPFTYSGEIDKEGNACGKGTAVLLDDPNITYEGTFYEN